MKGSDRSGFAPDDIELAGSGDRVVEPKLGQAVGELMSDGSTLAELEGSLKVQQALNRSTSHDSRQP